MYDALVVFDLLIFHRQLGETNWPIENLKFDCY